MPQARMSSCRGHADEEQRGICSLQHHSILQHLIDSAAEAGRTSTSPARCCTSTPAFPDSGNAHKRANSLPCVHHSSFPPAYLVVSCQDDHSIRSPVTTSVNSTTPSAYIASYHGASRCTCEFDRYIAEMQAAQRDADKAQPFVANFSNPLDYRSPMGFTFYLAIINNIFSICGLAGVLNAHRELVIAFFAFNAAQMVFSFHFFVDMVSDARINYAGAPPMLTSYEKASAAFIFFNFALSVAATVFAMRAVDEIRTKQREDYNRLTVLSDTLAFEPDRP